MTVPPPTLARLCACGCAWRSTDPRCWACGETAKSVPVLPHIPNAAGPNETHVRKVLVL